MRAKCNYCGSVMVKDEEYYSTDIYKIMLRCLNCKKAELITINKSELKPFKE